MVKQWMILLLVVMLALGVTPKKKEEKPANQGEKENTKELAKNLKEQMETQLNSNKDTITLAARCCKVVKIMPSIFKSVPSSCYSSILAVTRATTDEDRLATSCTMFECVLGDMHLINADKSVKEKETKEMFVKNSKNEIKVIMQAALDTCFAETKLLPDQGKTDTCQSGAGQLFGCVIGKVLNKCPQSMWHKYSKAECRNPPKNYSEQ